MLRSAPTYVREGLIGIAGAVVGAVFFLSTAANNWWERPYGRVHVTDVVRTETGIKVEADFVKWGCRLVEFVPYGVVAGRHIPLQEVDLHGREQNESREPGVHALDIFIPFNGLKPTQVELRTVHDCGDDEHDGKDLVTLVFAVVDVPPK